MGKVVKIQVQHHIRSFKSNVSCKILNEVNQKINFASDQELLICEPFCLLQPDSYYFSVRRTNNKERIGDTQQTIYRVSLEACDVLHIPTQVSLPT